MLFTTSAALISLLAVPASAFWRLPCVSPIVQERADPIVNTGAISPHLHTIMGGNGFGFTMNYASTQASTCSSCTVVGDNSNYWTPVLFYRHQNGSFEKVNQIGGATVYYLQRNATGEKIQAFPKNFQMLAGDPFKRTAGSDAASQAVSYKCLDYSGPDRPETGAFPTSNCPSGLRSQLFFPSCWDGQNVDSPNHMSHVSYPEGAYNAGKCPSTHPKRLMALFYEIIWDTNKFVNKWYGNSQPFVWSMGDPTGYGFHGDFVNGWDIDLLQRAADRCTNLSGRVEDCPVFKLIPDSTAQGCKVPDQIKERTTGVLDTLPGCNPVQSGPSRATPASGSACSSTTTPTIQDPSTESYFTDLTSKGWAYLGCATDNYYNRSIKAASTSLDTMSNNACTNYCQTKGYTYAGTEYSRECYCGSAFPTDRLPTPGYPGNCAMPCSGNSTQSCGGSGLLSLYKKCDSAAACKNAQIGKAAATGAVSSSSSASLSSTASVSTRSPLPVRVSSTAKASVTPRSVSVGELESQSQSEEIVPLLEQPEARREWKRHVLAHLAKRGHGRVRR